MRLLCCAVVVFAFTLSAFAGDPPTIWLDAPMLAGGTHLSLTVGNNATPISVQVDTGSTGIAIPMRFLQGATPVPPKDAPPPFIAYNSSGRAMCGRWVFADIALSGSKGPVVPIPDMQVLAIERVCMFAPGPVPNNPCAPCTPGKDESARGPAMMGVGFDRGPGMGGFEQNPFLQLPQMDAKTMTRAYIITTAGIQLGVTPADTATFQLVPLQPLAGFQGPWSQARGCVSIAGGGVTAPNRVCGDVLMDTGVNRMFLSYEKSAPSFDPPMQKDTLRVWDCCGIGPGVTPCGPGKPACVVNGSGTASVTVTWPESGTSVYSYTATAPQQFVPTGTSPLFANVWNGATYDDPAEKVFINTSRQLLNAADYLFDATNGRVGFRAKK